MQGGGNLIWNIRRVPKYTYRISTELDFMGMGGWRNTGNGEMIFAVIRMIESGKN